jgi:hypothetical protein
MVMTEDRVVSTATELLALWRHERTKLDRIDRWARWEHDAPHRPRHATQEYMELAARSQAPWGDLIVGSVAQTLYVEGYRRPAAPEDGTGWRIWQANGMDGRQVALHRAVLTYGIAYGVALPGRTLGGESMPTLRGVSPREMIAVYDDVAVDDWPLFALRVRAKKGGRLDLRLYDAEAEYRLAVDQMGANPRFVSTEDGGAVVMHEAGVCPVVRYTNRFDLEGRAAGEVEPFIPVLGKIDQTSFDRLVVQRFASWIVRTIAGMSVTESAIASDSSVEQVKMKLKVEDLLVAEDETTKFGSLPATPLDGFIRAHESDLTVLAAVSQTPAYELLGQLANLSAEALAAARASLTAKSEERKHTLGEQHEQLIRLALHLAGNAEGAADFAAQVRWADTTIRSLAQAVDAYGKLTQMLGFPPEALWPKVPGMTQQDIDEARQLAESRGDPMASLLEELVRGQGSPAGVGGVDG